jgi:hypothetical protein
MNAVQVTHAFQRRDKVQRQVTLYPFSRSVLSGGSLAGLELLEVPAADLHVS